MHIPVKLASLLLASQMANTADQDTSNSIDLASENKDYQRITVYLAGISPPLNDAGALNEDAISNSAEILKSVLAAKDINKLNQQINVILVSDPPTFDIDSDEGPRFNHTRPHRRHRGRDGNRHHRRPRSRRPHHNDDEDEHRSHSPHHSDDDEDHRRPHFRRPHFRRPHDGDEEDHHRRRPRPHHSDDEDELRSHSPHHSDDDEDYRWPHSPHSKDKESPNQSHHKCSHRKNRHNKSPKGSEHSKDATHHDMAPSNSASLSAEYKTTLGNIWSTMGTFLANGFQMNITGGRHVITKQEQDETKPLI
ncbi:hypothetical protein NADFUDRAFT_81521 [Nadsonia fulvescens var. elongata DSM 6958]|uniref:Uncharacterized protein n=1 Tax=Nadsonia fulvescens var. elongata DSM 6958 TaxID=857566 RepID=A0A1E3PT89_9ASCO|nr:hypothetical protein NADFUDRAFT_81521 [Nadsonia fulvescens var. elongata DSM 6958]